MFVNGQYVYVQGAANTPGFDLPVNAPIGGLMHSHYSGLLSIFSPDDLYSMVALYKANKMSDPETFYMGLVTTSGTPYLLYIDNMANFQTFADFITSTDSYDDYAWAYQNLFNIRPSNTGEVNEANFLNYIRGASIGVRLHKGNATFDQWSPVKSDGNGNTVPNPCN